MNDGLKTKQKCIYFLSLEYTSDKAGPLVPRTLPDWKKEKISSLAASGSDGLHFAAYLLLEKILMIYFDRDLADLAETAQGRPFLSAKNSPLFSISYDKNRIALAAGISSCLGIDIQYLIDPQSIEYSIIFSDAEIRYIRDGAEVIADSEAIRLTRQWSRKEAYLKAVGVGISDAASFCSVLPDPSDIIRPLSSGPPLLLRTVRRDDYFLSLCAGPKSFSCLKELDFSDGILGLSEKSRFIQH